MIDALWFWLSKRCALHFSRSYERPLRTHGLVWTLGLIDDDSGQYGNAYVHELAKAGVILRWERMQEKGDGHVDELA